MNNDNSKIELIGVIDEGTKAARFAIFKLPSFEELCAHEIPTTQIQPNGRWIEQDPLEILAAVRQSAAEAIKKLKGYSISDIVAIGLTNQRETTIVWDKFTGLPLYNAIVWSDVRTEETVQKVLDRLQNADPEAFKERTGLPLSPYFSAMKVMWLKDNVPAVRDAIEEKRCMFGTIDTWLVWNLTGATNGGLHITDVTNASRTLMMNIDTLEWDRPILEALEIDADILPEIHSSSEVFGTIRDGSILDGIQITGILANQQASLVGHSCFERGQTKNTYRSACFLMCNTGTQKVSSSDGLVTTVAYKLGKDQPAVYALEGSVAVGGAALEWLQSSLGFSESPAESEELASSVFSTGDVYFVPAFNGLYAPRWRKDSRGIICGLTAFTTRSHIIRAALEAICFQTRDILQAMEEDCAVQIMKINADGPLTINNLLMQLQADLTGNTVLRSTCYDTTARGAALAAGQTLGIDICNLKYQNLDSHQPTFQPEYHSFNPTTILDERIKRSKKWKMAVDRSSVFYENKS